MGRAQEEPGTLERFCNAQARYEVPPRCDPSLTSAQGTEVLGGLGHVILEQLHGGKGRCTTRSDPACVSNPPPCAAPHTIPAPAQPPAAAGAWAHSHRPCDPSTNKTWTRTAGQGWDRKLGSPHAVPQPRASQQLTLKTMRPRGCLRAAGAGSVAGSEEGRGLGKVLANMGLAAPTHSPVRSAVKEYLGRGHSDCIKGFGLLKNLADLRVLPPATSDCHLLIFQDKLSNFHKRQTQASSRQVSQKQLI